VKFGAKEIECRGKGNLERVFGFYFEEDEK